MKDLKALVFFDLKRLPRTLGKMFLLLVGCVLTGWLLLAAVYALPLAPIRSHVADCIKPIAAEGDYYRPITGSRLDNYTDCIELGIASFPTGENPLIACLRGSYYVSGSSPAETLVQEFFVSTDGLSVRNYDYYWHGYLVFLKPFLFLFRFSLFRELGPLVVLALVCTAALLMQRRGIGWLALPWLMAVVVLNPTAVGASLQFSPMFYLSVSAVILLLAHYHPLEQRNLWPFFFLVVGALTSYTDFLTAPLMTFGLPMAVLLALWGGSVLKQLWRMAGLGLSWALGYVGMWSGKWLIASAILRQNMFAVAVEQIFRRAGSSNELMGEADYTVLGCWAANLGELLSYSFDLMLIAGFVICLFRLVKNRPALTAERLTRCLPFAGLAVLPLVWYAFALNHSATHYWFTYRSLSVSVLAGYAILMLFGNPASDKEK